MTDADGSAEGVSRQSADEMLTELREEGGVLVAEADFSGDEIRFTDENRGEPFRVDSSIGGPPIHLSQDELAELIAENSEKLYWKGQSETGGRDDG